MSGCCALEKTVREQSLELTDEQVRLMERFSPEFRERHIETKHTGDLVAVDTFFVGVLKGVGRIYLDCKGDGLIFCQNRSVPCGAPIGPLLKTKGFFQVLPPKGRPHLGQREPSKMGVLGGNFFENHEYF